MIDKVRIQLKNSLNSLRGFHWAKHFSQPGWTALIYLILLGTAEYLVTHNEPQPGLILHALILIGLLLFASLDNQLTRRQFLLALSLAPLIRLISLVMPLKLFPMIYWYVIVAIPLFITTFIISRLTGITRHMAGLTLSVSPLQILVIESGLVLGYIEYLILRPAPLAPSLRLDLIWLPALILLVFTGLLEELIFRGLMQSTAISYLGHFGIPFTSAIFAVLHIGYRSMLDLLFVFGVALFFGYIVKYSGSILGVSIAHGLINITLFLVFPFLPV